MKAEILLYVLKNIAVSLNNLALYAKRVTFKELTLEINKSRQK